MTRADLVDRIGRALPQAAVSGPSGPAMIAVDRLARRFGLTHALSEVSFHVGRGEIVGLLGPNGAGKTTAVRILATLLRADSGTVTVAGVDVRADPGAARRLIGLSGQFAAVDPLLTGRENLTMIGRLYGRSRREAGARAAELLATFELEEAADRLARTYSGGMLRRLDLAGGLVGQTPILILDEPTTGLDPRSRRAMWDTIRRARADGATVLLTTQYLDEADALADRIVVLDRGRVVADDTPRALKDRVGEQVLEVHLASAAEAERAGAALGQALADADIRIGGPSNQVTIRVGRELSRVRAAIAALEAAGIMRAEVSLHGPTLDDVFFALTGRPDSPPPDTDADAADWAAS